MRRLCSMAALLPLLLGTHLQAVLGTDPPQGSRTLVRSHSSNTTILEKTLLKSTAPIRTSAENYPWSLSVARGTKLLTGMRSSDASAATFYSLSTTTESPFDDDMASTLLEWGYNDNIPAMQKLHDPKCNMNSASGHMLSDAFSTLGLDTRPRSQGGANTCFQIEHFDSPVTIKTPDGSLPAKVQQYYTVCGKQYRATGAEYTLGVNAAGGTVFAFNLASAVKSARSLWGMKPEAHELPAMRSVSDLAGVFWRRAVAETPGVDVQGIRYFFINMVINTETNRHMRRALQELDPPVDDFVGWPGHEFSMKSEVGKALLGSPVGRWAGCFLMQHKRQLGVDKVIEKVKVFKSQKAGSLPYLLFYVGGPSVTLASSPARNGAVVGMKAKL